jgi:molybdenum cofactor cytidylyltransferase
MICAIVLAAGRSTRMGTQKLLLPYLGKTIIGHVVDEVRRSPVDHAFVVTGEDHEGVVAALADRGLNFVRNLDPGADMLSSLRCGVRALPAGCKAVLIVLGDQPAVTGEVISSVIDGHRLHGDSIVVPVYGGRRGHPVLISMRYAREVLTAFDGVGLRGLLTAHPQDVVEVPVDVPGVLEDVDTPEDYRAASGGDSKIR